MGLYGEWLRLNPVELVQVKADPDRAFELADMAQEADDRQENPGVEHRRRFGTGKTWHALQYLMWRRDFALDIVMGEHLLVEDPLDPDEAPIAYLTADEVALAARELAAFQAHDLIAGVDPDELVQRDIYPGVWHGGEQLEWAVHFLPDVKVFFASAAENGDAVVCWID